MSAARATKSDRGSPDPGATLVRDADHGAVHQSRSTSCASIHPRVSSQRCPAAAPCRVSVVQPLSPPRRPPEETLSDAILSHARPHGHRTRAQGKAVRGLRHRLARVESGREERRARTGRGHWFESSVAHHPPTSVDAHLADVDPRRSQLARSALDCLRSLFGQARGSTDVARLIILALLGAYPPIRPDQLLARCFAEAGIGPN